MSLQANYFSGGCTRLRDWKRYWAYRASHYLSRNLVVITGCQRSGTTLTYMMLSAHGSIRGFDESEIQYGLPSFRWQLRNGVTHRLLLFKLPMTTAYLSDYQERLERTRFIWLVRNPLAVIASMKKFRFHNGRNWVDYSSAGELRRMSGILPEIRECKLTDLDDPIARSAWVWVYKLKAMEVFKAAGFSVYPVVYEALLSEPENMLHGVCDYLNISYSNSLLAYQERHAGKVYAGASRGDKPLDPSKLAPVLPLSEEEQQVIHTICSPYYADWGYQLQEDGELVFEGA